MEHINALFHICQIKGHSLTAGNKFEISDLVYTD
jgi:hypothetical protein